MVVKYEKRPGCYFPQPVPSEHEKELSGHGVATQAQLRHLRDLEAAETAKQDEVAAAVEAPQDYASVERADGPRRVFSTGSVRDRSEGKGDPFSIPYEAKRRLAVHFENGGKKYDRFNWRLGQPMSELLNSADRHLALLMAGDGAEDHAAAVLWNIAVYMDQERRLRLGLLPPTLEDRPEDLRVVAGMRREP